MITEVGRKALSRMGFGYGQMKKQLPTFVDITEEVELLATLIQPLGQLLPLFPHEELVFYVEDDNDDNDEITIQQIKVAAIVNAITGANRLKVPNIPRTFAKGIRNVLIGLLKFNTTGDEGHEQLTKIGEALKALSLKLITNCGDQEVIDFYVDLDAML